MIRRFEKKKKKCFEGGDDVFWRKMINVLKIKLKMEKNLVERKKSR